MPTARPGHACLKRRATIALILLPLLGACAFSDPPTETPEPTPTAAASVGPTPTVPPTPTPSPTPEPTPRFTNEPDAGLRELIPETAAGVPVVVAGIDEFALTPGDVGSAYGELGNRFASLAIAYVEQPRTTLYAVRVDGEPVATRDLRPHLATAGRYVGIAGLDPDPWRRAVVGGHEVWVRPEDNATALGTMIYTWSSGEFVFLLIGVDDAVNQALVAALPGQPRQRPATSDSPSPGASDGPGESADPGATATDGSGG